MDHRGRREMSNVEQGITNVEGKMKSGLMEKWNVGILE
jgi:hypothetical protein